MGNSNSAEPLISTPIDQFPLIWIQNNDQSSTPYEAEVKEYNMQCIQTEHCFREDFDPEWLKDTLEFWCNRIVLRIFCHKDVPLNCQH